MSSVLDGGSGVISPGTFERSRESVGDLAEFRLEAIVECGGEAGSRGGVDMMRVVIYRSDIVVQ